MSLLNLYSELPVTRSFTDSCVASSSASLSLSSVLLARKHYLKNFLTYYGVVSGVEVIGTAIIGLCCVDKVALKDVEPRGKDCSILLGYVGKFRRLGRGYVLENRAR